MQKGRQCKVRYIQKMPMIAQFSPRGKVGRPDEIELRVDQFEAIKLADFQGFDQSEGAKAMGLSRPSFGRILRQGRRVLADALVNGKTLRIRIGNVQVGVRQHDFPNKRTVESSQEVERTFRENILQYPRKQPEVAPEAIRESIRKPRK